MKVTRFDTMEEFSASAEPGKEWHGWLTRGEFIT